MAEYWQGQKILFVTEKWGKEYVWLQDVDGTVYMVRLIDGVPQFA